MNHYPVATRVTDDSRKIWRPVRESNSLINVRSVEPGSTRRAKLEVPERIELSYSNLRTVAPGSTGRTNGHPKWSRTTVSVLRRDATRSAGRVIWLVPAEGIEPPQPPCKRGRLPLHQAGVYGPRRVNRTLVKRLSAVFPTIGRSLGNLHKVETFFSRYKT